MGNNPITVLKKLVCTVLVYFLSKLIKRWEKVCLNVDRGQFLQFVESFALALWRKSNYDFIIFSQFTF